MPSFHVDQLALGQEQLASARHGGGGLFGIGGVRGEDEHLGGNAAHVETRPAEPDAVVQHRDAEAGETIVVEGTQKVRPGAIVNPKPFDPAGKPASEDAKPAAEGAKPAAKG